MQKSKLLYLKLVDNKLKKREIKGPCFYANFECNTVLHMNLVIFTTSQNRTASLFFA